MTRVRGRKKIIWVPFGTQQVSCDWQSPSQNYSSRSNPSSRVSFAAQAVLMTCLTAACWSLESALTRRAVNREMRESIEIKPSLFWQPRWKGAQRLCRGGEEGLGGGGFNCMWGPSQRWRVWSINTGTTKANRTLNGETMRHEGRAIGLHSWPWDTTHYAAIIPAVDQLSVQLRWRVSHWEDRVMPCLRAPLPPGIVFIQPSSESKGVYVSQCLF